jgi:prolyl-tRNA synthetase
MKTKLPNIKQNFAEWYNEVVYKAELADLSPVRGTMVIMPYGYEIWERIQAVLDKRIKETGHKNAAFPLLIPKSFLEKEAEHVKGFSPELAVVTHAGGKELEEPLVVRPTSETIIHHMFSRWIKSWRDLPLKINQWCSVVRWEMRSRPFLRTTEFFWQEGHTAHETEKEAIEEMELMFSEYQKLAEEYLAIPVIVGRKTDTERFPGAVITKTFEGMMPDGKALQMGTSHYLSQSFAHAFDMRFQNKEEKIAYPYLTSWGVTTRLIGALVMTHGDNQGLIIPPKIAPIQVVIIPIIKKDDNKSDMLEYIEKISDLLKNRGIRVYVDAAEHTTPGEKFYNWELKGVPLRFDVGNREYREQKVMSVNRVTKEKVPIVYDQISAKTIMLLDEIQGQLFLRAKERIAAQEFYVTKLQDFATDLETKGGFYYTNWCGSASCETVLKNHKASIRCIISDEPKQKTCFSCNQNAMHQVVIARAY